MADGAQFDLLPLTPDVAGSFRDGRQIPPPPAPGGRPKGAKNKLRRTDPLWREARNWSPGILDKIIARAIRLEDEIDFKCAQLVLSRTWQKPRSAPIQIDLSQNVDARTLLLAVMQGEMTPADASSLWNSLSRNGNGHTPAEVTGPARDDVRESVAARLAGIVAARQAIAESHAESGRVGVTTGNTLMLLPLQPEAGRADDDEPLSTDELERLVTEMEGKHGRSNGA